MKRLQIKLTPELVAVLNEMGVAVGPYIETALRQLPEVERTRKKLKLQWTERRKVGNLSKVKSANA